MVGFRTGNDEVCAETGGGKARCTLDLGHLGFDIADTGKIDQVERILDLLAYVWQN